MNLPRPALATKTIKLNGESVELHAMSASQALHMREIDSESARAVWMVACSFGITEAEAQEWFDAVAIELVADALVAIVEVSGLENAVTVEGPSGPKASAARKLTSVS